MDNNTYNSLNDYKPKVQILLNVIDNKDFKPFRREEKGIQIIYVNEEDCAKMLKTLFNKQANTHGNAYNKMNKGKKSTYCNRYGNAVKNLRNEGRTIREIAETLGISTGSVQKIIRETMK